MGSSWLRSRSDGNVSVSGCGEPIPPSTFLFGGVAQTCRALACQARGRRFESGRPCSHGGRGVDGSTRGCDPRWRRFEPGRPPSTRADAEQR
jgi:hypothetical protein